MSYGDSFRAELEVWAASPDHCPQSAWEERRGEGRGRPQLPQDPDGKVTAWTDHSPMGSRLGTGLPRLGPLEQNTHP